MSCATVAASLRLPGFWPIARTAYRVVTLANDPS
jgi:hypothetical protein